MHGNDVFDQHVATRRSGSHHKRTRLDLVRDHGIGGAVQALHAHDADHIGARSLDIGAHGIEKIGQVHDVRLLGGVDDDRAPLGAHRGHHEVGRGADRDDIQIDFAAVQHAVRRSGDDVTVLQRNLGAQRLHSL